MVSSNNVHPSAPLPLADLSLPPLPFFTPSGLSTRVLQTHHLSLLDASSPPLASKDLDHSISPLAPSSSALLFFRERLRSV